MRFGYGVITCQRYPGDPRSDQDLYEEALAVAVEAERVGFDSLWVAEHHFWDDSWMPSPLPVLSAMAARTTKIQLGTAIMQTPLHPPLLLAEEVATVDLLSKGRLVLGLGGGWRPTEFEAMGIPFTQRARRIEETVEILRRAWSNAAVTGEGLSRLHIPDGGVEVFPKPARPEGPPIWLGGAVEPAVRRAGRIADGWLSHSTSVSRFAQEVEWIRSEVAGGRPFDFGSCLPCLAWNDGPATEAALDYFYYYHWKFHDVVQVAPVKSARVAESTAAAPPPLGGDEGVRRLEGAIYGLATNATANVPAEDMVGVFGTPVEVADTIKTFADVVDGDLHFVAQLYLPGMPLERRIEAMNIFAEEVIPSVRGG